MGSQVLNPKYDLDAYVAALFEDKSWELCWSLDGTKKIDPTLNTSPRSDFDEHKPYFNDFLRLKSWDLGPGTWDPMWIGPKSLQIHGVGDHWPFTIYKSREICCIWVLQKLLNWTENSHHLTLESNPTNNYYNYMDPLHFFPPVTHEPHVFQCTRCLSSY